MTRLEVAALSKTFGDTQALDSVSLSVAEGEFFTLLGPSGCGKTTTLRIVAGLTQPTAGTVRFDGRSMAGVGPEDRSVGIVFQHYALFPHMTVEENVGYGLRFESPPDGLSKRERVRELLDFVDLSGLADRDPTTLSGGQQQRVALARALAPGPDILLLDEPLSALDARLRDRLRRTIRSIQRDLEITTLYVTHDQREALSVSDRIAVMNDGRIEQVGTPEAVYAQPANTFVAGFLGDNNLLEVVDVEDGRAVVAGGATVWVEEPVATGNTLAVRPEAMHLGDGENTLSVSVETVEFRGGSYLIDGRLGGEPVLVEADRAPPNGEEPGGTVTVGFPSDAIQVLEE